MIPKALNEIEWSDLEALKDSGREEDDTIEFKGSFSGGADFLAFNDKQQAAAIDGIAKEVIAFLNGRGGDVVIGAKEFKNDHPKIEALTPLPNVVQTVDRLAQALAAVIEPTQSIIGVRAVLTPADDAMGAIVLRTQSSLRAPHRSRRTRECYVRRGRESVPMPMDEVQDIALNRYRARNERNEILDKQFSDVGLNRIGLRDLRADRSHFRICYLPNNLGQVTLDEKILREMFGGDELLSNGRRAFRDTVAFDSLNHIWRPELRGRVVEGYSEHNENFMYAKKSIKLNLLMMTEFAIRHKFLAQDVERKVVYLDWLVGYLANSMQSIRHVLSSKPNLSSGTLRVAAYFGEGQSLGIGQRDLGGNHRFMPGTTLLPDFSVEGPDSLNEIFIQAQVDMCELAGVECPHPFSLPAE